MKNFPWRSEKPHSKIISNATQFEEFILFDTLLMKKFKT